MDRGAQQATVHGAAKSLTQQKQLSTYTYTFIAEKAFRAS